MKERELEALLDAERRAPDPPAEARARVLHRVQVSVGLAAAVTAGAAKAATTGAAQAAGTGAHTAAAVGGKALVVKLVLGAVGAALLGGGAYVALRHPPAPSALQPAPQTSERVAPRPPPQVVVVPSRPQVRQSAAPRPLGLADEQAFLEEARAALLNGSPERALKLLAQHARNFPAGQLGDARDSLIIQALVAEGRRDAARARAAEFRRRHPHSLFQPAVDASLGR